MRNYFRFLLGLAVSLLLGFARVASASDEGCDLRLIVEMTPDVPDASDPGFASSLLSNHPEYDPDLLQRGDPTVIERDLFSPGPDYQSRDLTETMREEARVFAVRLISTDVRSSLMTPAAVQDTPRVQLSTAGLGSLIWAAQHPQRAWKVLLPIQPGKPLGDEVLKEYDVEGPQGIGVTAVPNQLTAAISLP